MNELTDNLEPKIASLPIDFINTLRENDSLIHFMKNFIINNICQKTNLEINFEDLNKSFCLSNKIKEVAANTLVITRYHGGSYEDYKRYRSINESKARALLRLIRRKR